LQPLTLNARAMNAAARAVGTAKIVEITEALRLSSAPRGSHVVLGHRFRMEQGADGLTAIDPAHGFGQGRRDGQYRELRYAFFGRDGNRVRADYFEYVRLGGKALGGGIGENSVCAGDPYGTGFVVAQMPKQFQT
jgi:hypothetical protein